MSARDDYRALQAELLSRARAKGIDLSDLLSRDPRIAQTQLANVLSGVGPAPGRFVLTNDIPLLGVRDGANTLFGLSGAVVGQNIMVVHCFGNAQVLAKSNSAEPAAGSFTFDGTNVRVGLPPQTTDTILGIYLAPR